MVEGLSPIILITSVGQEELLHQQIKPGIKAIRLKKLDTHAVGEKKEKKNNKKREDCS